VHKYDILSPGRPKRENSEISCFEKFSVGFKTLLHVWTSFLKVKGEKKCINMIFKSRQAKMVPKKEKF
jgi:hypothetical protein